MSQFVVLYPTAAAVRTALRGCAAHRLAWFDAHLPHDCLYGTVRVVDPFR